MVNKMVSHILEEEPLEDLVCDAQPDLSDDLSLELDDRQRYYLIWSLWNYAIIQIFQQLQLRLKNNDKKFTNNIVSEIKELEKEHQQDNQINCSFVEGYWRYVKLTQIHNELFSELNKECNQGYPDDYIFIKEEDMYTGDDAIINDIDSVIDKELHRMFHSGAEPCAKLETFKNRMQTCKELLSDYCRITSRNPPLNDLRTWRAFYRTLYINPIEFDRKKIINLVRNVIQFPEKRDPKLLEKHYRVSVMFSIALREEYQICGTALLDFMSCFYSLSLKRMYDDFPETGCSDDIEIKTMELSDEMEKVSEIMYSSYFQIK
jgi:ribulose bisphosphate carboxylase small subunit